MKKLINDSLQSLPVWLLTPPKNKVVWIQPKKSITVEDHQISNMANILANRKMIRIVNVPLKSSTVDFTSSPITASEPVIAQKPVSNKTKKV